MFKKNTISKSYSKTYMNSFIKMFLYATLVAFLFLEKLKKDNVIISETQQVWNSI